MTTSRQRLARAVLSRRNELGMKTQTALAEAAQVSRASINAIETGKKVSPNVISLVELALNWAPGSADTILAGGEPAIRPAAVAMSATGTAAVGDGRVDVAKASPEDLAALFMDLAKGHSDAELMEAMARVMRLRAQGEASREAG